MIVMKAEVIQKKMIMKKMRRKGSNIKWKKWTLTRRLMLERR